jgi:outer membrane protein assembly factor BamD
MNRFQKIFSGLTLCLVLLVATGCGGAQQSVSEDKSIGGAFKYARSLYDQKDYTGAQLELSKLLYSSRTTEYEDDVQFYLAQSYFKNGQYLLAADGYQNLLRNVSSSPYNRAAFYQIGACYYNLSPVYSLDQDYARRAIQQFQAFIDAYPVADSAQVAKEMKDLRELAEATADQSRKVQYTNLITRLESQLGQLDTVRLAEEGIRLSREKLALKALEAAQQYIQLRAYKAATIYYDEVMTGYSDSPYYETALLGKIDMLLLREKWTEAKDDIEKYEERFPDRKSRVEGAKAKVREMLQAASQTTSK